ncbi:MAG: hypothetical protein K9K40_06815 [Desulfotignum sp.]|nr:hypothetical protein [Desulfotignum sp.]MCF8124742.1 hypothetical protein [Desulfotignum sp.]
MLKKDLSLRSPIEKIIGIENITDSSFGAVLSRAGVGKTRFLVQIALIQLLNDEKIVHVSLDDSMGKINLRYNEGYTNLVDSIGYVDPQKALRLWDDISLNKVGISYNEASFDTTKIKDYLKSFKKARLPLPAIMIIDGLNFDEDITDILEDLRSLNQEFNISIWFAMQTHRDESLSKDGYPVQLETRKQLFDKALFLKPVNNKIQAVVLKDGNKTSQKFLLNPATMMLVTEDK